MPQRYLILDYETYSECDLKKAGAYEYSKHPSTEIICAAYRYGTLEKIKKDKTLLWIRDDDTNSKWDLVSLILEPDTKIIAHNAIFEQYITEHVLLSDLETTRPEKWICTASMAAAMALPRNLEGVTSALNLSHKKDMEGHRLMLKLSKPRRPTKNNPSTRHTNQKELERLYQYCIRDIDAEVELFLKLNELSEMERKVWLLDQKINWRGFNTDRELVLKILSLIEEETKELHSQTRQCTNGALKSVAQRDEVLKFIRQTGVEIPDLRKGTVSEYVGKTTGVAQKLLEIRQSVSKSSTAKYKRFEQQTRTDGRVRDFLMYHGASTGRWAGKGVQIQNLTRGSIKDTDQACEIIKKSDLETIRMLYGNPMEAFSSVLRGMIIPTPGYTLFCGDYAAVETRVLFWIAHNKKGLDAYRNDKDLYKEMAAAIYKKDVADISTQERQLGKAAILGAGYGMGYKKFLATCLQQGQEIDEGLARRAITSYRETHSSVPIFWSAMERAAITATKNPGKMFFKNNIGWALRGDFLVCLLPSKRCLYYPYPEVKYEPHPFLKDTTKETLYHYGIDSMKKKWVKSSTYGGKLTENVVQAIARDLMAEAMLRLDNAGYQILLSVHDELLCEKENGNLKEFESLMSENPKWAGDLPTKVEAWSGFRYHK